MTEEVRDHWWWRPGWREGRSFYAWHITFTDQPEAARLVSAYRELMDSLPTVNPVPVQWLHLTLQGVGFTDRVERGELDQIIAATRARCAGLAPITVTIGPAQVNPETVQLPVRPIEQLEELRATIRAAIADVWGPDSVPEGTGLVPHVSLGYWHTGGPAAPLVDVLTATPEHTAEMTISRVTLIDLNRDRRMYEWTEVASVPLG